jgi:hypothetical protein
MLPDIDSFILDDDRSIFPCIVREFSRPDCALLA